MAGGFTVTIDDREVRRALQQMERFAKGTSKAAWAEVGEHMKKAVDDTFEKEGARDGHPRWKDLKKRTWDRRREGRGQGSGKILQDTVRLRKSIWYRPAPRYAKIGSSLEYAATHQFGRGAIPARPFLFVTHKDWDKIGRILLKHALSGFPRR